MRIAAVVLTFLAGMPVQAQDVGLTATAEKQDLRMGEPVIVTVTVRTSVEVDSIGPFPADSIGLFEVLGYAQRNERAWSFELMTIDTGSVFLPPIAFGYIASGDTVVRKAYANSLMFRIGGVDVPEDADIKDIKPPMNAPWAWADIWPYLLVAVLALGGWWLYRKYGRKEKTVPEEPAAAAPPTPPHTLALRALRELEEKKLWQQGRTKAYYSECTEIVRRFFEGRFGFQSLEQTSSETIDELHERNVDPAIVDALREFFGTADMVKFAKREPTPADHERELTIAYDVVRGLAPRPDPQNELREKSVVG